MSEKVVTVDELQPGYYYYYRGRPLGFFSTNIMLDGHNYQRFTKENPKIPGDHKYDDQLLPVNAKLTKMEPVTDTEGDSDLEYEEDFLGGRKSRKTKKMKTRIRKTRIRKTKKMKTRNRKNRK